MSVVEVVNDISPTRNDVDSIKQVWFYKVRNASCLTVKPKNRPDPAGARKIAVELYDSQPCIASLLHALKDQTLPFVIFWLKIDV